jgi:hypothetical protein
MAIQKITADVISSDAITTNSISDSAITAAKLAGTLDLTGKTITVATASSGDNDTTVASTAFVATAIANLADSAPSTLDTLNELAAALGDDANFSTTVTNSIATKLPLAGGTLTGALVVTADTNPALEISRGSANTTNVNLKYNTTLTGQLSAANAEFQISAAGSSTPIEFFTNGSERMRIRETGAIEIKGSSTTSQAQGFITNDNSVLTIGSSVSGSVVKDIAFASPSTMMYIDGSTASVGIGTTSPDGKLHVYQSDASITPDADADDFIIEGNGATGMTIGSSASSVGSIRFADSGSPRAGMIYYNHVGNEMRFYTVATERMRIDSSGNVGIGATSPAKPLHLKRTSGWATMRLEGASDSGGELEFYAASTKKGSIWFGNDGGFNVRVNGADDTIKINSSRVMAVGGGSPLGTNSGTIQAGGDVAATDNFTTLGTHLSLVYTAGTGQEMHISRSNGNRVATFTEGQNLLLGDITSNYLTYGALQVARGGYTAGHGGIVGFFDTDVSVASSNLIQVLSFSGDSDATGGAFIRFSDSNSTLGQITAANGTQCSYGVSSDERLKENIVDASSQLDLINNIRVREFDWKVNGYHEVGMIAQELNTVVPSVVQEGGDDITEQPWTVDYGKLTPYLIKAIQELKTELDAAKARITELEG